MKLNSPDGIDETSVEVCRVDVVAVVVVESFQIGCS
jgi:hypothetical protein